MAVVARVTEQLIAESSPAASASQTSVGTYMLSCCYYCSCFCGSGGGGGGDGGG